MRHDAAGRFLLALVLACLMGCAAPHTAPRQHVIVVDGDGRPVNPDWPPERESALEYREHLNAIEQAILSYPKKQVLVFVHGGLNTIDGGLEHAAELVDQIGATDYYPICINWNSEFFPTYAEHLFSVRQGRRVPWWEGMLTSPLYLLGDLGRAIVRAPIVWYLQIKTDVTTMSADLPGWMKKRLAKIGPEPKPTAVEQARQVRGIAKDLDISVGADKRTWPNKTLRGTTYVITLPVKLVTGPFVDALGKSAWDNMSRRTHTMYRLPEEFENDQVNDPGSRARGATSRLFRRLRDLTAADQNLEITLIGHSMGAMVLNEALRAYPELRVKRIVYLGAACSVRDFAESVVPFLQGHPDTHFYSLMLHPMAEARELPMGVVDLVPRGSLLEWIDNFYTTPLTVDDRRLGKWDNIIRTTELIPTNVASRVHFKAFGVGPGNVACTNAPPVLFTEGDPQTHGTLDDPDFWMEDYWQTRPCDR